MGHADLKVLRRYLAQTTEDIAQAHRIGSPVDKTGYKIYCVFSNKTPEKLLYFSLSFICFRHSILRAFEHNLEI
jgi:hypothetical protein